MYKKQRKILSWLLVVSMILIQMVFVNTVSYAAVTAQKDRLYGSGRIQTAIEISKAGWKGSSDYAVLATAYDFPDALCAAPLAKRYSAPLLLTDGSTLDSDVKAELRRLNVKNIIIVGGTGVISDNVFNAVREIARTERIYGSNREETSVEVAKRIGTVSKAVLATGFDFPDALSISSIAASIGMPILLTERDNLNPNVESYLKYNGIQTTYIIGGTGVISSGIETRVPGPFRIAGSDRVQTNYEVINRFAQSLDFSKVYVATALNFPDALAGSALAAMTSSPIVLADGPVLSTTRDLVKSKVKSSVNIVSLGGASVVTDSIADGLVAAVNGYDVSPDALKVESVSSIGRNQIKVVFTKKVDETSAETASNYLLDGLQMSSFDKFALQSDKKTVVITMDRAVDQFTKKLFSIKDKAIYSEDELTTVARYDYELLFNDADIPGIRSVTAVGDKKITVVFTEAVKMPSTFISSMETSFKIDGQYLANFGFYGGTAVNVTNGNFYSDTLELNFNTGLPSGNHTLTIPDGTVTQLADATNLVLSRVNISFSVNSFSSMPRIVSVDGQTNGTVYVTYDRTMDQTARAQSAYHIGNSSAIAADFKPDTDNTVVKVVFDPSSVIKGANILIIENDIKDTYGNKLNSQEDISFPFVADQDTTKPTVLNVSMVDEKQIRVRFSEPMDTEYSTKVSNYTIRDSSGQVLDYVSSVGLESATGGYDVYSIILNTALTGSNYTLEIRNLVDRASTRNMLDDYKATISVNDSVAPKILEEVMSLVAPSQIVIYFSEAMDRNSISNKDNLTYRNGNDQYLSLPTSTSLDVGPGDKSLIVTLPAGYTVKTSGWSGAYDVRGIRLANVKDASGNLIEGVVAYKDVVSSASSSTKPTYVSNTFRLYDNGDKISAEFEFNQPIAIMRITDFRVVDRIPDAGVVSGGKITLTYTETEKVDAIRRAGPDAKLYSVSTGSANAAGTPIQYISTTAVYDEKLAPKLVSASGSNSQSEDVISLKFSEKIDEGVPGLYIDDFVFIGGGSILTPMYVTVSYDTVTYHFNSNTFNSTDIVRIKASERDASIRDIKDTYGDQNIYKPSLSDISGINVTVQ